MQYFFIFLLFIILGIIWKRSIIILICIYLMLLVVSVSFTNGHDIILYKDAFEQPLVDPENDEIYRSALFANFIILLQLLGLNFNEFRIVCVILWSLPLLYFIIRYSKKPTYVVAVCAFFPLLTYSSLIRNGLMVGVLYWAFIILLDKHKYKRYILFILLVAFASLIHNTAFFYLLALIAINNKISTKSLIKWSFSIPIIAAVVFQSGLANSIVSKLIGEYYSDHYLTIKGDFQPGHIHYILFIFVNLWAVAIANNSIMKYVNKNSKTFKLSLFVKRLNILMMIFIPLLFISVTFYRIFLNLLILNVICVSNSFFIVKNKYIHNIKTLNIIYLIAYIMEVYMYNLGMGEFYIFWNSISI